MQTENLVGLGDLIQAHQGKLIEAWKREVALLPGAKQLDGTTIIDHIPQLLVEISENLRSDRNETSTIISPSDHGIQRWNVGFDITEVVKEYGILRACRSSC